jgi:hypothetical protein
MTLPSSVLLQDEPGHPVRNAIPDGVFHCGLFRICEWPNSASTNAAQIIETIFHETTVDVLGIAPISDYLIG